MITEDYVSFEIAKLLKTKGFDEKCQKVYIHNGQLLWAQIFMEGESFVDNKCIEEVANYDNWITYTQGEYAYLCPTLQMAMKWLREEKGVAIIPILSSVLDNEKFLWDIKIIVAKTYDTYSQGWVYEKQESACDVAIKYCLENLI